VRVHVRDGVWDAADGQAAAYDGGRDAGAGEDELGEGAGRDSGRDAAVAASGAAHSDRPLRADAPEREATFACTENRAAPEAASHSKDPDLIELHPGAPFPDLQLGASTAPDSAPAQWRPPVAGPGTVPQRYRKSTLLKFSQVSITNAVFFLNTIFIVHFFFC